MFTLYMPMAVITNSNIVSMTEHHGVQQKSRIAKAITVGILTWLLMAMTNFMLHIRRTITRLYTCILTAHLGVITKSLQVHRSVPLVSQSIQTTILIFPLSQPAVIVEEGSVLLHMMAPVGVRALLNQVVTSAVNLLSSLMRTTMLTSHIKTDRTQN